MKKDDFYIRHENGRMNKTAGKKVMKDIRSVARKLVELPEHRLPAILPLLEPGMVKSVEICRKMDTRNHGRNREENYLAKQLLHMDAEERARIMEAVEHGQPSTSGRKGGKAGTSKRAAAAATAAAAGVSFAAPQATTSLADVLAGVEQAVAGEGDADESYEDMDENDRVGEEPAEVADDNRVQNVGGQQVVSANDPAGAAFLRAVDAGPEIDRLALEWKGKLLDGCKETQRMYVRSPYPSLSFSLNKIA